MSQHVSSHSTHLTDTRSPVFRIQLTGRDFGIAATAAGGLRTTDGPQRPLSWSRRMVLSRSALPTMDTSLGSTATTVTIGFNRIPNADHSTRAAIGMLIALYTKAKTRFCHL